MMSRRVSLLAVLALLWCQSAFAQTDFMGVWRPLPRNQDGSGMTGDIAGVPASDAARWRVQSWSPEDFDVTEWACRPHVWDYSLEGPLSALRPPANAPHSWSGFSTAEWDGDTLVVTTTHLKEAYLRRDGLMRSDEAT